MCFKTGQVEIVVEYYEIQNNTSGLLETRKILQDRQRHFALGANKKVAPSIYQKNPYYFSIF